MGMGRFRKNFKALRDHACNCHFFAIGSNYSDCRDWGANKVGGESNATYLKNASTACDFDCTDSEILSVGGAVPNR